MSKTRDNSPELDYFELRRRHEEFKRARSAPQQEKTSVEERLERQVAQQKANPEPVAVEVEEAPINDVQDELNVEAKAAPMDAFEEAIEENYEAYEDDMDYDEDADEEAANPNPFDSFIRFFNGMKSNMSSRRHKDDELEDLDLEDLTDEELAELEDDDLADLDEDFEEEAAPAKSRFSLRRKAQPDVEEEEEDIASAEDIEDLDDPRPARKAAQSFADEDFDDSDFDDLDDEDFDDEDFDEDDLDDEDDAPRKGGFKKFVNLFVTRVDEDEEFDEDEEDEDFDDDELEDVDFDDEDDEDLEEIEEDEEPVRKGFFSRVRKNKARSIEEDEEIYDDIVPEIQIGPKGGQDKMDEMNKLAPETTAQADVIETSGMSRRERRELAMRLAAEEAARKAEEEALAKAEAAPVEPLFTDLEEKQAPVDMAAFEGAPETDLIVETTAEEVIEAIDEPTREFTPVSMRDVQEAAEKALFDVDDEDEDFDDEDEDDEDEIIEKKPRRGLFGRKRAKVKEDDEDDFDDEDEDDDVDEDDDDDDEIVEKKPRRGLFGRKRAKDEEEDEDDFDDEDEDDSDDEDDDDDEYDEYDDDEEDDYSDDDDDEYDDDYDDDDDDDEDEPRRSFGHHLIGVFKIILGLILVLLIVVIGLNFHYFITGENAVVTKAHEMLGDSSASDVLCFGYVMRETLPAEEAAAPEVVIEAEITAEPTALPQVEADIPDLDNNGAITETPVVEAAPVIDAAPAVAEAPVASGAIG